MSNPNIGWLFDVDYFDENAEDGINYKIGDNKEEKEHIKELNEDHLKVKIQNIINQTPKIADLELLGNIHFRGTTTYPGLLIGIGNIHELKSVEGQAILGFHFDYTTGLPVIPGSSIKGVLRSVFKCPDYIKELLSELHLDDTMDIGKLELEIFGQRNDSDSTIQGKDVFFDVTIVDTRMAGNKILGDDYLAPHGDNPLSEPDAVLRFIKVLPQVTFMFDFELCDDGLLDSAKKALLFAKILADIGLGAKTNVGYGQLELDISDIPQASEFEVLIDTLGKTTDIKDVPTLLERLEEPLSNEQKDIIFDIYNKRLLEENNNLNDDWYDIDIKTWINNSMTNGERKKLMNYQYLNIFKVLFKD